MKREEINTTDVTNKNYHVWVEDGPLLDVLKEVK